MSVDTDSPDDFVPCCGPFPPRAQYGYFIAMLSKGTCLPPNTAIEGNRLVLYYDQYLFSGAPVAHGYRSICWGLGHGCSAGLKIPFVRLYALPRLRILTSRCHCIGHHCSWSSKCAQNRPDTDLPAISEERYRTRQIYCRSQLSLRVRGPRRCYPPSVSKYAECGLG